MFMIFYEIINVKSCGFRMEQFLFYIFQSFLISNIFAGTLFKRKFFKKAPYGAEDCYSFLYLNQELDNLYFQFPENPY